MVIAQHDGFTLIELKRQDGWRSMKLTHRGGFVGSGRRRKRNWWLGWNGERLARNYDAGKLYQYHPDIYAWVVRECEAATKAAA
jgi:hypothetical protein